MARRRKKKSRKSKLHKLNAGLRKYLREKRKGKKHSKRRRKAKSSHKRRKHGGRKIRYTGVKRRKHSRRKGRRSHVRRHKGRRHHRHSKRASRAARIARAMEASLKRNPHASASAVSAEVAAHRNAYREKLRAAFREHQRNAPLPLP